MIRYASLIITGLLCGGNMVNAFYLPGVAPQSFSFGDEVKLKVNSLSSSKELLPMDPYHLPFCQPEGGPVVDHENLGELLSGDKIESSPYVLRMKEDMFCEQLCVADLGSLEKNPLKKQKNFFKANRKDKKRMKELRKKGKIVRDDKNKVAGAIRRNYKNNWIVDNLSAASKVEDDTFVNTTYARGFPVGFMGSDHKPYVFNHVNIEIMYHPVETETGRYRVVRFTVEPFSINHILKGEEAKGKKMKYDIINPILSCGSDKPPHTSFDVIKSHNPQIAYGEVLFTYDVIWKENLNLKWASRWDVYLQMDNVVPTQLHWTNIYNWIILVVFFTIIVASILMKSLRRDIGSYNRIPTDEERAEEQVEFGWKLVHADVFRAPKFSSLLLSVLVGTGLQLLGMAFFTILMAALGFINPSFRGSLLMALILFYALMGTVSGYTTARLYKTFKGKRWQFATTLTATFFPGCAFLIFFLLDIVAWAHHSTDAVPFMTMITLFVIWFGMSTPLVFLGANFGYKQESINYPVNTSSIPREIPARPWFYHPFVCVLLGGLAPFGSAYVEMYFIMSSIWGGQYYYVFGALFVVLLVLIVSVAEISILLNYFFLKSEDYNWWWRSFYTSGSCAIYFMLQTLQFFQEMETNSFSSYILYFGYNFILCFGIFLMTGSVGFFSSLIFNKIIFGAIKVD